MKSPESNIGQPSRQEAPKQIPNADELFNVPSDLDDDSWNQYWQPVDITMDNGEVKTWQMDPLANPRGVEGVKGFVTKILSPNEGAQVLQALAERQSKIKQSREAEKPKFKTAKQIEAEQYEAAKHEAGIRAEMQQEKFNEAESARKKEREAQGVSMQENIQTTVKNVQGYVERVNRATSQFTEVADISASTFKNEAANYVTDAEVQFQGVYDKLTQAKGAIKIEDAEKILRNMQQNIERMKLAFQWASEQALNKPRAGEQSQIKELVAEKKAMLKKMGEDAEAFAQSYRRESPNMARAA